MDIEILRDYCLQKKAVTEDTPFGPDTLVFKVGGKVFCLCGIDNFSKMNLKCDPEWAAELRANYLAIAPGFHMNKKHWNTVSIHQDAPDTFILELVDHSYDLVLNSIPKLRRKELGLH